MARASCAWPGSAADRLDARLRVAGEGFRQNCMGVALYWHESMWRNACAARVPMELSMEQFVGRMEVG